MMEAKVIGADETPAKASAAPVLSVVVPSFNEAGNMPLMVENLGKALKDVPWELIVVDDDSPDGTAEVVKSLSRQHPNVRCLRRIGRRGLSSACIEGISASAAPFVAVMDADHQHDERILPKMLAEAEQGADLVVGSRYVDGGSAGEGFTETRLRGSQLATTLSALVLGKKTTDPMSGFFLMRRDKFDQLASRLATDGFKILLDIIVSAGSANVDLKIAEVPYTFRTRHAGDSKMSPLITVQFLGLWLSKLTRGLLPTTFLLFSMVGASGIFVHMTVLWATQTQMGASFTVGQITATMLAMTWNFFLNNELTYANKRLRGIKMLTGLLSFYLVCSLGAIANISVAEIIYSVRPGAYVAGLAGALMSAVFNYAVTRMFTWR